MNFKIFNGAWRKPIKYYTKKIFGFPSQSLEEASSRKWTLAPGSQEPAEKIFYPENHLKRIQPAVWGETTTDIIHAVMKTEVIHEPTMAYSLRDCSLVGPRMFSGMYKHDLYRQGLDRFLKKRCEVGYFESAVLASTYSGARWFGHLLHDEFPLQMCARDLGNPVSHMRLSYSQEPGYRELFGVSAPPRFDILHAKEMTVLSDFSQNTYKRERYAAMRGRLSCLPKGHDRVFISRGTTGHLRLLMNESEIARKLEGEGFKIISPEKHSPVEVLGFCHNASIVVSLDGSHAVPALFATKKHGRVVMLYPPNRVNVRHLGSIAFAMNLCFGMFVCEPSSDSPDKFSANPDELIKFINYFCDKEIP